MKTKLIPLYAIICTLFLASCDRETVRVSDAVSTREVRISGFSGLEVAQSFRAFVTFSDTEEKIEIEANDNVHDKILVSLDGDNLYVRIKPNTNLRGDVTLNLYITTSSLERFRATGASRIQLENELSEREVFIRLSGSSDFFGELNVDVTKVYASGASKTDIFGSTSFLEAELAGSSTLQDLDFQVADLDIELSGASDAYLSVSDRIDVEASGSSTLTYRGDAVIRKQDLSGASEIIKRD
ncbi:head GIN domain-containing protein [Poritiphilus flavus]|uniref:Putative auto-transporter adhesin head GIN domain-containing protein n=1 Tax=Poritiphilus flavus TaxID=2697053 RepID=A0A6L9EG23_9FLAO|nr:head GIN domain-containing protein [Poritiphilus flavus]NAS13572.1 hypothetical protein [Poritiphilus flavus]